MTKEVMKQALDAFEAIMMARDIDSATTIAKNARYGLREALKQEQDEPVAMRYDFDGYGYKYIDSGSGSDWQTREKGAEPLYTTPQQRKPLTDEQIEEIADGYLVDYRIPAGCAWNFARDIEAAHGIKE